MPTATFGRHIADLGLKPNTWFLNPALAVAGKMARLRWAQRWTVSIGSGTQKFSAMANVVHIDEKWFYLVRDKQRYYVRVHELSPTRRVQHECHVVKPMFLGVVARPRRNTSNNTDFDGKI